MCGSSVHCGAAEASGSSTCRRGSVQIPLGGTDHTLSADPGLRPSPLRPREYPTSQRTSSGRVRDPVRSVKWNLARPRPTRLCRSLVGCGRVVSKFHYTDPRTLSETRPDQIHGHSPYMSRLSGQVYDSGLWVWSGRVREMEFRHDTTRPDQRQSLFGPL